MRSILPKRGRLVGGALVCGALVVGSLTLANKANNNTDATNLPKEINDVLEKNHGRVKTIKTASGHTIEYADDLATLLKAAADEKVMTIVIDISKGDWTAKVVLPIDKSAVIKGIFATAIAAAAYWWFGTTGGSASGGMSHFVGGTTALGIVRDAIVIDSSDEVPEVPEVPEKDKSISELFKSEQFKNFTTMKASDGLHYILVRK